jgi:hypothetical protein
MLTPCELADLKQDAKEASDYARKAPQPQSKDRPEGPASGVSVRH